MGLESDDDHAQGQAAALRTLLEPLTREELRMFALLFDELDGRAARHDVWSGGYVLSGGLSDDSFDYFRRWLISRGRSLYERFLVDPYNWADGLRFSAGHNAERYGYVVLELYEERYGDLLDESSLEDLEAEIAALVDVDEPAAIREQVASGVAEIEWTNGTSTYYSALGSA